MSISRRRALVVTGSALALAATSGAAQARQPRHPRMHEALTALEQSLAALEAAEPDKGGHRSKAIKLVREAMSEVRQGIEFDSEQVSVDEKAKRKAKAKN